MKTHKTSFYEFYKILFATGMSTAEKAELAAY